MTIAKSTRQRSRGKQQKPRRDVPLTAHRHSRQWCKKDAGKTYYFGSLDDPDAAESKFHHDWPHILKGEAPPPMGGEREGLTVRQLCNAYHKAQELRLQEGRIVHRTFSERYAVCAKIVEFFGRDTLIEDLKPSDFRAFRGDLANSLGPVSLGNWITRIRSVFKFGYEDSLLEHPVKFGTDFRKPSPQDIEKAKAASDDDDCRTFAAAELLRVLDRVKDDPALNAMVLLSLNCAYGVADLSRLRLSEVNVTTGWARSRRPKTGAKRGAKLWPETVKAVKSYRKIRPKPKADADANILFITRTGKRWLRESRGADPTKWSSRTDLIGNRFGKILRDLGINGGRRVYALRHTAATIADKAGDRQAVQYLLGHRDGSMTASYVDDVPPDERMEAIATHVRRWLFAEGGAA